ncbi:hypothetical protein NMC42_07020 [Pseudomonas aeruginosa]
MFGSNDDKKAPQGGEKKGLFGWWRKSRKPASSLPISLSSRSPRQRPPSSARLPMTWRNP